MKINQGIAPFKPITITLETFEEADALWHLVEREHTKHPKNGSARNLAIQLSNWFGSNL